MSDAGDERVIAGMRRRLRLRAVLNVLTSFAALATVFILGLGFHMITRPIRWPPIALVSAVALLVGALGLTAAWWVTRLPPEALSERIALRQSDRTQQFLARIYLFFPLILGVLGVLASILVGQVLDHGWQIPDVIGGVGVLVLSMAYLPLLTGWGAVRRGRLAFDEELFLSFRMRGYIAGFWSVLAGLMVVLGLGLARPAWAVEGLPVLIAVGICVPAVTIALLNRRAERDG